MGPVAASLKLKTLNDNPYFKFYSLAKLEMINGAIIIEGHVQGLSNVRSIGELGIPVFVVDKDIPLAKFSKYCKKFFRVDNYTNEDLINLLIQIAEQNHIIDWLLIPSNDHIVENLSHHKNELSKYYKMFVPEPNILYKIINKACLMSVANQCGINIPATCCISNISQAQNMKFPILIKGNKGLSFYKATHKKAIQVNSYNELLAVIDNLRNVIDMSDIMVQELITEDPQEKVISFTCFAEKGRIRAYWAGMKLREHPIKYGTATCAISIHKDELIVQASSLMNALNYTGVCEIEFMKNLTDGNYYLIEINPRTWLWVGLAKACGINYVQMMYNYASGIKIDYPTSYKEGVIWINSITDTLFSIIALLKKRIKFKRYFSFILHKTHHAIWSWNDIVPGCIYPFMLLYIYNKRK